MTTTKPTVTITAKSAKIEHPDFIAGYGYNPKGELMFFSKINNGDVETMTPAQLGVDNPFNLQEGLIRGIAATIEKLTFIKNK